MSIPLYLIRFTLFFIVSLFSANLLLSAPFYSRHVPMTVWAKLPIANNRGTVNLRPELLVAVHALFAFQGTINDGI